MDSQEEGICGLRTMALRPIETKSKNRFGGDIEMTKSEEDFEEPLSPAGRLFNEANLSIHILSIMGCKTKIDPHVVKLNLPHTLLKHPRFSSLLVYDQQNGNSGNMKWVRTNVDLDKHIIIPEVMDIASNEEDIGSADKFVEDYIHNLTKTKLDMYSKPLWELHILNVKTSMAESVAIFRIHHSLGDGISLMSLLLACTRQTSDPNALPTLPTKKIIELKTSTNNTRFLSVLYGLWWVFKLFWNTVVDIVMFISTRFLVKDTKTPIKGPPGSENNPRRVVFGFVSLDDMKLVKRAMNMTINDVALGITQAGLSKYLNRKYGVEIKKDKGETQKKNNLPKKIRLRSILFINIRPSPGIQALADMMEKNTKAKWGNSFGYVLLPFTIGLRDDPLDYIREAKATVDRKKHSLEALYSFYMAGFLYKFFGMKSTSTLFRRLFTNTTLAFSNVVGPIEEVGFYGHPMAFLAATTYGQASELMVNFQSYVNKMSIVLSVDETTIPDPYQLLDDIIQSLKIIKDTLIVKGIAK